MDVSIKSSDKQAREAFIKARNEKIDAGVNKRLRRHIEKSVRTHLRREKRLFVAGKATGNEYRINPVIRYKHDNWRSSCDYVERVLSEVLAKHTGFEYKVGYICEVGKWCIVIKIWYTLLEQ